MTDSEFLRAFFEIKFGKECWTHEAHVRLAFLLLKKHGEQRKALDEARVGIMSFNNAVGARVGYHETITRAYLTLVEREMQTLSAETWADFLIEASATLLAPGLKALDRHYTRAYLMSADAKARFAEPDLKPLPAKGCLREARASDAEAILGIYAPYVRDTSVSFEYEVPSLDEMKKRIEEHSKLGWLVYEIDGRVAGYAYASKHRAREAYQWCCEVSAYVDPGHHRDGVGRVLYAALLDRLAKRGLVNAYAGITLPNEKSVGFHESFGFRKIGVYEKIGFKHGSWHDVGWWGLRLNSAVSVDEAPHRL